MTIADRPPVAPEPATAPGRGLPPSALVLVAANLAPLAGVLLLGWSVFPILLLYWCENVVVGAVNVLKIAFAQPRNVAVDLGKLFLIPFFVVHYGMFTLVHGIFVVALFGPRGLGGPSPFGIAAAVKGAHIGWAVLVIAASHGYSFLHNYLFSGEYRQASPQVLMGQPYARVVLLHVTILLGGFGAMALGQPAAALFVLVVLKTAIDLRAHLAERKKLGAAA